jgi:hypothetical protein
MLCRERTEELKLLFDKQYVEDLAPVDDDADMDQILFWIMMAWEIQISELEKMATPQLLLLAMIQ